MIQGLGLNPQPTEARLRGLPFAITPGELESSTPRDQIPTSPGPKADGAPTLSTLSGQVGALEAEVGRLRQTEMALRESNDALRLLSETANELLSSEKPQEVINTVYEKLSARLGL